MMMEGRSDRIRGLGRVLPPKLALAVLGLAVLGLALPGLALPGGLAAGFHAPLHAQTPDTLPRDSVYRIDPIAVRAVRPSATLGGVGSVRVRLDSVLLRPAPLLEDVLRELPLVQVRTNSRGEAQLAMRGAEERQIAILLDGVPLTLGWDHRTDLSVIPMTAAQTVQLVRGMSSVLHGPNVLGGVVEIGMGSVPASSVEPLQASGSIDDRGGYAMGVMTAAQLDVGANDLVVRAGMGRRVRDGLAAPDAAPSFYPALGDGTLLRNSDLEHTDAFLSARASRSGVGWLSTTVSGYEATRGVPPELDTDAPRLWRYPETSRMVTILSGGLDALANRIGLATVDLNLGLDAGTTRIENFSLPLDAADPDLPARAFFSTVDELEESDDRTFTLRARGTQAVGGAAVSAAATFADIQHEEVITVNLAQGPAERVRGNYRQRLWSLGVETDVPFELGDGTLRSGRLSAGLVWDGADTPGGGPGGVGAGTMTEWGGRLGATASTADDRLLLHTAVSRRGRFPALRELYSTALGRFEPNRELRPEIQTAVEAGLTTRHGAYDVQLVAFHQRLDDAIVRGAPPAGSDARYMRVNRDRIRSSGLELLAGYTMGRLALETEATLQSVQVSEPGATGVRAEYEPTFAGGVGGVAPLMAGIEASAEVRYWSAQYCAAPAPGQDEYRELDPGARTDVQLARTFPLEPARATLQHMSLELAVDNLTDSTLYDQCGLPAPGRTFRIQLRVH